MQGNRRWNLNWLKNVVDSIEVQVIRLKRRSTTFRIQDFFFSPTFLYFSFSLSLLDWSKSGFFIWITAWFLVEILIKKTHFFERLETCFSRYLFFFTFFFFYLFVFFRWLFFRWILLIFVFLLFFFLIFYWIYSYFVFTFFKMFFFQFFDSFHFIYFHFFLVLDIRTDQKLTRVIIGHDIDQSQISYL